MTIRPAITSRITSRNTPSIITVSETHRKLQEPPGQWGPGVLLPDKVDIDTGEMSVSLLFADGNKRDGVGDLTDIHGIRTDRHRKNPIVLFDHGKQVTIPIALTETRKNKDYTVELDEISKTGRAKCFFYQGTGLNGVELDKEYDHALLCEQLFDLVARGFLRGGSFGYITLDYKHLPPYNKDANGRPVGLHLLATLLLEVSLVVLPCNEDTVGKMLSLPAVCGQPLSSYLVKSLQPYQPPTKKVVGFSTKTLKNNTELRKLMKEADAKKKKDESPDYGYLFIHPKKEEVWYVTADGDSREFTRWLFPALEKVVGKGKVRMEAESSPPEDEGWEKIHKGLTKSLVNSTERVSVPHGNLSETKIPPPKAKPGWIDQKLMKLRERYSKKSGSYFATCPRDDRGKCKPKGTGDETSRDRERADRTKLSPPARPPATPDGGNSERSPVRGKTIERWYSRRGHGREMIIVENGVITASADPRIAVVGQKVDRRRLEAAGWAMRTARPKRYAPPARTKTMSRKTTVKTKALPDDDLDRADPARISAEADAMDDDIDNVATGGSTMPEMEDEVNAALGAEPGDEKYSAQVVRRMHEDARTLLEEYDEMMQPLEHPEIAEYVHSKLIRLVDELDELEMVFSQHHGDANPLEGMQPGRDYGEEPMAEGEEIPGEAPEDTSAETTEELAPGTEAETESEGEPTEADSGEMDEPTPEEAYEGSRRRENKSLTGAQIKDLRNKYKRKPKKRAPVTPPTTPPATEPVATPKKPDDDPPEEGFRRPGGGHFGGRSGSGGRFAGFKGKKSTTKSTKEKKCSCGKTPCVCGTKDGGGMVDTGVPDPTQVVSEVTGLGKGLHPHEKSKVGECASFLHGVSQDGSILDERGRMDAWHFHKCMKDIAEAMNESEMTPSVNGQTKDIVADVVPPGDSSPEAGAHPHRKACKDASEFLQTLAHSRDHGMDNRYLAAHHHTVLQAIAEAAEEGGVQQEPGETPDDPEAGSIDPDGTKNISFRLDKRLRDMEEMETTLAQLSSRW